MLVEPLGNISLGPGEETGAETGEGPEAEAGAEELDQPEVLYSGGLHLHHCADTLRGRHGQVRGREREEEKCFFFLFFLQTTAKPGAALQTPPSLD